MYESHLRRSYIAARCEHMLARERRMYAAIGAATQCHQSNGVPPRTSTTRQLERTVTLVRS